MERKLFIYNSRMLRARAGFIFWPYPAPLTLRFFPDGPPQFEQRGKRPDSARSRNPLFQKVEQEGRRGVIGGGVGGRGARHIS